MVSKINLMKVFLLIWLAGAIITFILHFFYPNFVSDLSFWTISIGWQKEIALWNLAMILIIVFVLIKRDYNIFRFVVLILSLISLLMGINHLFELIINNKIVIINLLGAVLNLIMAVWGGFILKNEKYK